jgi:hypothetical protein
MTILLHVERVFQVHIRYTLQYGNAMTLHCA